MYKASLNDVTHSILVNGNVVMILHIRAYRYEGMTFVIFVIPSDSDRFVPIPNIEICLL